jgi:dTDP-4-amino-4,6-dideoxygalactose transaminase
MKYLRFALLFLFSNILQSNYRLKLFKFFIKEIQMFEIGQKELAAVAEVIKNGQFMRYRGGEGGFTEAFEKAMSEEFRIKYALAVNSGTSALICSLAAMGIGPGDEVIVPAYTWVASAMSVCAVGAVPILADIDETLTIDPGDIERKITPYTKAVIPVHMLNVSCDMDPIMKIAESHGLLVLEDACQAVGITYKGRTLGTIGDMGVLSFNMYKNITCGEGGALLTNNDKFYERALMYHDAGCYTREHAKNMHEPFFPGVNYRVSEIQGAILGEQFKRLQGIIKNLQERRKILAEVFTLCDKFKIIKSNDESSAASIQIVFDKPLKNDSLVEKGGRHIYTNWEPLMQQNAFHENMNPFKWAKRKITYTDDMCQKTLDLLARVKNIEIPYNMSLDETQIYAEGICNEYV